MIGPPFQTSDELRGLRNIFRDFGPDLRIKHHQIKPIIPGTVPTNRDTAAPKDSGPASDPKFQSDFVHQDSPSTSLAQFMDLSLDPYIFGVGLGLGSSKVGSGLCGRSPGMPQ